jgi:hypothetical protein
MNKNYNLFISQLNIFFSLLLKIQEEHWYWFNSRHGVYKSQEHDLITNHIELTFIDSKTVVFKIQENSEMPHDIREQCMLAYEWIFSVD